MEYLYKYYYNNAPKDYKEEVKRRLLSPSRIEFDFKVKQYKREDMHRL